MLWYQASLQPKGLLKFTSTARALSDQQGMVLGQRGSCPDAGRERLTVTVCGTVTFATRVTRDGARLPVTALSPECCFGDGG